MILKNFYKAQSGINVDFANGVTSAYTPSFQNMFNTLGSYTITNNQAINYMFSSDSTPVKFEDIKLGDSPLTTIRVAANTLSNNSRVLALTNTGASEVSINKIGLQSAVNASTGQYALWWAMDLPATVKIPPSESATIIIQVP